MSEVFANWEQFSIRVRRDMTERAITKMLIAAGVYASALTPRATGYLLNSQYRRTSPSANGYEGVIGYGAEYAVRVHNAPGTLLGTNTPRYPESDGFVWGPNAEPQFLKKGIAEMIENDARRIIMEEYTR